MLLSKIKVATAVLLVGAALTVIGTRIGQGESGLGLKAGLASQAKPADEEIRGSDREEKKAPQEAQGPASPSNVFGGGPGERRYEYNQSGNLIFVTSPQGDEFSIYHISKNKAGTIRLPNSKESPLHVTPIEDEERPGNQNLVALKLEGPKLTRLYAFSLEDCKWYPQDLKEPVAGVLNPIVSNWVAAYAQGRTIYAFDAQAKRWNTLELPQGAPAQPDMSASFDSVWVEYDGHIYEFSSRTGEWKHRDLRDLIDAAIKSAEDEAK